MSNLDKKKIKILYLGTPELSAKVLEKLILSGYNIIGVVAQCDKELNRKKELIPVPTKVVANKYNIPVFQKEKIRNDFEFIKELNPDLILTLAYGQIIPHDLLIIPKLGCLNLHGSLLPKYRGAAPIQYSLLNGDSITGVTLMEMVDEMDAGKMYYKTIIKIDDNDNYTTLTDKMVDSAFECFDAGIDAVINKENLGEEQNIKEVTFTHKINRDIEKLNFNDSAKHIKNIIRALTNEPGCYFIYNNEKFKVFNAEIINSSTNAPGQILAYDKNSLVIGTKDYPLRITKIQRQGKKILEIKDFFIGKPDLFIINDFVNND